MNQKGESKKAIKLAEIPILLKDKKKVNTRNNSGDSYNSRRGPSNNDNDNYISNKGSKNNAGDRYNNKSGSNNQISDVYSNRRGSYTTASNPDSNYSRYEKQSNNTGNSNKTISAKSSAIPASVPDDVLHDTLKKELRVRSILFYVFCSCHDIFAHSFHCHMPLTKINHIGSKENSGLAILEAFATLCYLDACWNGILCRV
jgi:hypothetical protein